MAYTAEQFFGKIGVSKGIFTQKELDECFKIQRERYKINGRREPLSYILQEKKLVTREQMYQILQEFKYSCMRRDDKKVAEIIKEKELLTGAEVEIALKFQRKLFRSGVGLFQLGEILISKEILDEQAVYDVLCEYWLQRNPGKELPEHAKPQKLVKVADEKRISSATKMQVEKIHESEGKSGYKVCEICNHENSLDAIYCQGCSERLLKYTIKVKTDINNVTIFKKEVNEELQTAEIESVIKCQSCGFQNPIVAEICYNCFTPLHENSTNPETHDIANEETDEFQVKLKDLPESLDSFSDETVEKNIKQEQAKRFLIENKKKEINEERAYRSEDSSHSGDTLIYEPIVYDPTSSKLFLPATIEVKTMKRCPKCGYMNCQILPFCFACHEIFESHE